MEDDVRISALTLTVNDVIQSQAVYAEGWPDIAASQRGAMQSAHLSFRATAPTASAPKASGRLPAYWKFSVFTDDLETARIRLIQLGWTVTQPVQFLDVGFLCHTTDPNGLDIELLQRTFEPPRARPIESPSTKWLRGPETLGLITLRISSVESNLAFYQAILNMKLLAIMDVNDGRAEPFSLYFLASTNDKPPSLDPRSVDNREWLYHRPYTIIELQHHWPVNGPGRQLWHAPMSVPGFSHVDIQADAIEPIWERAQRAGAGSEYQNDALWLRSPDGHQFRLQTP